MLQFYNSIKIWKYTIKNYNYRIKYIMNDNLKQNWNQTKVKGKKKDYLHIILAMHLNVLKLISIICSRSNQKSFFFFQNSMND